MERFAALRDGDSREALRHDYHSALYRRDTEAGFTLPDGTEFTGVIRGVDPTGELTIETPGGPRKFLFHEVSFVI
jgi:biotin-(acetyl-CoA carboxylase) ligase